MRIPNITLRQAGNHIDTLYAMCNALFQQRKHFLKEYTKKYSIPAIIQQLANAEVYASFYFTLFENDSAIHYLKRHIHEDNNPYVQALKQADFNHPQFYFNTNLTQLAASSYWIDKATINSGQDALSTNKGLMDLYAHIKNATMDVAIKNHLLTEVLVWSAKNKISCYDSLVQDYQQMEPILPTKPI